MTHSPLFHCKHCHHTHESGMSCSCDGHDMPERDCSCNEQHDDSGCRSALKESEDPSDEDEDDIRLHADIAFHILKLDCPNCAASIQGAVRMLDCTQEAYLQFETAMLYVVLKPGFDEIKAKQEIIKAVRSCGEDVELTHEETCELEVQRTWYQEHRDILLMFLSGVSLLIGGINEFMWGVSITSSIFYILAAIFGLIFILPMAISALMRRRADMNVLMSIAVIGGIIMGFLGDVDVFRDAAIVIFLDQIGEWLEGWSMRKTSSAISDLMKLAPEYAHLIRGPQTEDVLVADVVTGDVIKVLPGERVALDGTILKGDSSLNEAAITGESVSVDKHEGDNVYAGTLNEGGVLTVRVSAPSTESTLSKIVEQVQNAQAKAAPYQSFVNRFAEVYTPFVVWGAIVVGIAVPSIMTFMGYATENLWLTWVYRALSLLVVACPCALVISTPVSFVSAITCAARKGVLVKGGASLDAASKIQSLVIDKTGTLTTGKLSVEKFDVLDKENHDVADVLYALESLSSHPIARSVSDFLDKTGVSKIELEHVEEIPGTGVVGTYKDQTWFVGKASARDYFKASEKQEEMIADNLSKGLTMLVVSCDKIVVALVGIADAPRENAEIAISELHSIGISPIVMMTGDNELVAQRVAYEVGVDEYRAECMPADKLKYVEALENAGTRVAMVGDGINDAPALATSSLAITMGADASDTALDVADVALLNSNLENIDGLIKLSRRTMNVVRENIAFAIIVKVAIFILIVIGIAGMSAAVFADTGVALIVILNGMRLMVNHEFKEV